MKKLLLISCLFMISVMTFGQTRADVANRAEEVFIINGKSFSNFTGEELIGKTVNFYAYSIKIDEKTGKITFLNIITTKDYTPKYKLEDNVYLVDGKVVDSKAIKAISPDSIQSMEVLKAGNKEAKALSGSDKKNVIKITLKKNK